jgi:YVTN family beta-propeller protein
MRRSALWLGGVLCAAVVTGAGLLGMRHARAGPVVATVAVGRLPWRVVVDERRGRAFVVNRGDGTVSVLDSGTGALLRTVAVGIDPVAAAVDEGTGRVFVANGGDATVSVLDARSGAVLGVVVVGTSPQGLAVDGRAGRVFVPNRSDGTVSVLDARSGALLRTVALGYTPWPAAASVGNGDVLVGAAGRTDSMGDATGAGTVRMLDARGAGTRTEQSIPVGVFPVDIGVDAERGRVIVLNYGARWSDGGPVATVTAEGWWVPLQRWLAARSPLVPAPRRPRPSLNGSVTVLDVSGL